MDDELMDMVVIAVFAFVMAELMAVVVFLDVF